MVYILLYTIERFLTPIVFVFYVLFGLFEVADAPEFVLVVVCKILAIEVYCYWSGWDIALFWNSIIYIYQFVGYRVKLFR